MAEGHETCQREISALKDLVFQLGRRLDALEERTLPEQEDPSDGKYELYVIDSPTRAQCEVTRIILPPSPLNRSQSAGANQGGTSRSCVSSAFHHHDTNSISMIQAGEIRSYQSGDSSVEDSEAESPSGTPRKPLRIDTSPLMHLSRTASISSRVAMHKETEHLDSEDEKEEHRARTSSRRSAVCTNSCSFSHSNSLTKQRSLSLFRSSGPVNYTGGPVGPTCFAEYFTEFVSHGPDPIALKSNVIECARTDKEAYEELKEVRAILISRLGLHKGKGQANSQAWLERFLYAAGLDDPISRNELLLQFSKEFILQATTRARVILEEMHLPQHNKTIKPLLVGGVAGGTKFLDNDILFKFADDPKIGGRKHLYGETEPDHERAAKAAANDLKGADAYFRCFALLGRIPVVVPPQVVMDFNGFRLIAMPWLPLRDAKLSYGSGDGGKTVHDEDDIMKASMKFAAHHLHLARHYVKGKMLDCAGDVEAHVGKDERRYLVDLARTFPPEDPHSTYLEYDSAVVFYRLHRTEFMEHLKSLQDRERFPSLSPDAFSKWGDKPDNLRHNENALRAMRYLISQRIPELVNFLKTQDNMTQNLGQVMQSWGISVRHMGLVRLKAREACCKPSLIQQLLVNMVARCCKNLLRRNLREANNKNVDDSLALFLNSLTQLNAQTQESLMLWEVQLPHDLTRRFGSVALASDEYKKLHSVCQQSLGFILKYLLAQTGVTLKASWRPGFRFFRDSFLPISVRSKTFSALEALLQEDNILQACKAPNRDSFFCLVTKLSRKASEDLAALLNIIDDPEELLKYFQNRAGKKGQNVQLLVMCALGLFFSDIDVEKDYPKQIQLDIENSPEAVVLDLVPRLPQIFSDAQRQSLLTSKLQTLCDSERLQSGARELAQALLAAQANPNAQSLETRDPLLHTCVTRGHKPVAEALFEAKASVHNMDAFHHSLEQIVFSYSTDSTRFAEMLGLKPPTHLLHHSVRLRVHLLLSDKPTSLNVLQKLTLTVKMKSPLMKKSSNSPIHRMQVVNSSKENQTTHFPVNMEATFPEWPPNDTLKCTLTCGNNNRVADVYIPRHAEGFSTILLTMVHKGNHPKFVLKGDIFVASSAKPPPPPPKSPTPKQSVSKVGSSSNLKSLYSSPSFVSRSTKSRSCSSETDPFKVLILGISESGKSALDKRLCGNLLKEEIPRYVNIIRCNAISGVQTLIMGSRAKLYPLNPINQRSVSYVTNLAEVFDLKPDDLAELLPHLKTVLSDPGIQLTRLDPTVFQMSDAVDRNPWHVNDTADHFLNKLDEIFDKNYVPSSLDCFACRTRSQGVVEHKVFTGPPSGPGGFWRVCKGGGSARQRQKWPMIYDGTDGLIFTVSLVGYDRVSENARTNRMEESLDMWESVVSSEGLRGSSFVLLFTFDDKFKRMIESHNPLKDTKSAFAGFFAQHPSYKDACDYLTHAFVSKAKVASLKVVFVDLLNDESYNAAYKEIQLFFSQRSAKGLLEEY